MSSIRTPLTVSPHEYFGDATGRPLDYGTIYFGEPDKDPEFYPIDVYSDEALTQPIPQPIRTKGGFINVNGDIIEIYGRPAIYSVKVLDQYGRKIFYKGKAMRNNVNDDIIAEIDAAIQQSKDDGVEYAKKAVREAINKEAIEGGEQVDTFVVATPKFNGAIARTQADKNTDVLSIKDFGAVGDGVTDDTQAIKNALEFAKGNSIYAYTIIFPAGKYQISETILIPNSPLGNIEFLGLGNAEVIASKVFPIGDFMLVTENNGNHLNHRLRLTNITLRGSFRSSGLKILGINEWNLHNIAIWNCIVGIAMSATYYGGITGTSLIRESLIGLKTFTDDRTDITEVNTILISNLKINGGNYVKSRFPADFQNIDTKGIELCTSVLGLNIFNCTIEGYGYGIYGFNYGDTDTETKAGNLKTKLTINNCYFEVINSYAVYLSDFSGNKYDIIKEVSIRNCWTAGSGSSKIYLSGAGFIDIFENNGINITVNNVTNRLMLNTDCSNIKYEKSMSHYNLGTYQALIEYPKVVLSGINQYKYTKNKTNTYPNAQTALANRSDYEYALVPSPINNKLSKINDVRNVCVNPLTFKSINKGGTKQKNHAGLVLQSESDNKYYMLTLKSVEQGIVYKEVKNLDRLSEPANSYTAAELYYNNGIANGSYYCLDVQRWLTKEDGVVKDGDYTTIGTTEDFLTKAPINGSYHTPTLWNVDIECGYTNQSTYFAWGPDWYGNKTNIRAVGTISQRPVTPDIDWMIYLATDEEKYYEWKDAKWEDYTL